MRAAAKKFGSVQSAERFTALSATGHHARIAGAEHTVTQDKEVSRVNIVVTVLAVIVGGFGGITACRMAAEGVSVMPAVLGIAGAVALVAGAIMARKNMPHVVKILWASVVVCVVALVIDTSGAAIELFDETIKGEELYGGLAVWGAISAGFAMYASKKTAEVKES